MINEKSIITIANTVSANIHAQKKHLDKIGLINCQLDKRLEEEKLFDAGFIDELKLLTDMLFDYLCAIRKDIKECSEYAEKLKDMLKASEKGGVEKCI